MSDSIQPQEIDLANQRSLEELAWAIEASQGQFSLILARCNYAKLRSPLVQQLQASCSIPIRVLTLQQSTTTLYSRIREEVEAGQPNALMILGLEHLDDLEQMLSAVNSVREEFRKNFHFPLIFWIGDDTLKKLVRLAPDLESWASSVEFTIPPTTLIQALEQACDRLFASLLTLDSNQAFDELLPTVDLGFLERSEVEFALHDLQQHGQTLAPTLQASLDFACGLGASNYTAALPYFQRSLQFWQQASTAKPQTSTSKPELLTSKLETSTSDLETPTSELETSTSKLKFLTSHAKLRTSNLDSRKLRQGLLLFFIAQTRFVLAEQERRQKPDWQQVKQPLQQCFELFEQENRLDLVAKCIILLARVLQKMQVWDELETIAQKALDLHRTYGTSSRIAQDYGFWARAAIERQQWTVGREQAEQALATVATFAEGHHWLESLFLLFLAQAEQGLGNPETAIDHLVQARSYGDQGRPTVYIRVLKVLRQLYYKQGQYLEAFQAKRERLSIEQQYGIRAFIGAGRLQAQRQEVETEAIDARPTTTQPEGTVAQEIAAAGRQRDLERLLERIGRNDYKLIVVHGFSGVGKSSLINAGLVPALKQKAIGTRSNLPVLIRQYTDWAATLETALFTALAERRGIEANPHENGTECISEILHQLRQNDDRYLRTVLIFDQFEEFFFVEPDLVKRRLFYKFLSNCLSILNVKVILSLREDYIHYLLECNRLSNLEVIANDILSKNVLYSLGNFSPTDARAIIQNLTDRAQFYLEPALVDELVNDLAAELGEVRPIELQIVGAQLQTENITTVAAYRQLQQPNIPAREMLVERYLSDVVQDCGTENQQIAELVLYLLTDENNTRPPKTRTELTETLPVEATQLDLVLEVLVRSGMVQLLPENPVDRYQLVHDYLVPYIRQKHRAELEAKLELEQKQRKLAEEKQRQSEEKLHLILQQQLQEAKRIVLRLSILGILLAGAVVATVAFSIQADQQKRRAEISEISALLASSEALLSSHKDLDALVSILKAGIRIKQTSTVAQKNVEQVSDTLERVVYSVQELNRLEKHAAPVYTVSYSPDGKMLASASQDKTVRLWSVDGTLLNILNEHGDEVTFVAFSPDGKTIASASSDKTIKLWSVDGSLLENLRGHSETVIGISFSPDGKTIASASSDKTIKLWSVDGSLVRTLKGHTDKVTSVDFSPNGEMLASASGDKTIKLWKIDDGNLLRTLNGHSEGVRTVKFSPDGNKLVSSSYDKSLRLWHINGKLINDLYGHTGAVFSVNFSPDNKTIVSASDDRTIKLWDLDGTLIKTIYGHREKVYSVTFSPDGKTIASASADRSIRLWKNSSDLINTLPISNNEFSDVSFSPDGKTIAASGSDSLIRIWNTSGSLRKTLKGHSGQVFSLSFSPNGKVLASAGLDKTVRLWAVDGKILRTLKAHQKDVRSVAFSPDGQIVASGSLDGTVKLWKLDGTPISTLSGHHNGVRNIAFSPDGKLLATANGDSTVNLWNINGSLVKTLKGHSKLVRAVAFSPNGKVLVSASLDETIVMWNLEGQRLKTLRGHSSGVIEVRFSPDGKFLASASRDYTIKLWRLADESVKTISGHEDAVTGISFSPDSEVLASASADTTVKIWDLNNENFFNLSDSGTPALDELLTSSCNWLDNYLKTNPHVDGQDRHLCKEVN